MKPLSSTQKLLVSLTIGVFSLGGFLRGVSRQISTKRERALHPAEQ